MSSKPQHVVMTFPDPLSSPGGGPIGCLSIARALHDLGVDVTLVPVSRTSDLHVDDLPISIRSSLPSRVHYLLDGLGILKSVRSTCAARTTAAVLSWSHEGAFLPGFLRRRGISFGMIAAFPDYRLFKRRRTELRWVKGLADHWFRKRPLQRADVVFALSTFTAGQLTEVMGVDPRCIRKTYWGVPPLFLEIPRRRRPTVSRILFFGAFTEGKGVTDLLGALAQVREQGETAWELRMAGWGDEDGLRQAASELGIIEQVKFLGRLSHEELLPVLEWADLAILPSRAESFGLAIAEAQAAGLPVVSCRTGAVPEIVEDGLTGWLVEPGDSQAIASALLAAMRGPKQAFDMGMAGRERVANRFTWRATAEAMAEGLLEPAPPPIAA